MAVDIPLFNLLLVGMATEHYSLYCSCALSDDLYPYIQYRPISLCHQQLGLLHHPYVIARAMRLPQWWHWNIRFRRWVCVVMVTMRECASRMHAAGTFSYSYISRIASWRLTWIYLQRDVIRKENLAENWRRRMRYFWRLLCLTLSGT